MDNHLLSCKSDVQSDGMADILSRVSYHEKTCSSHPVKKISSEKGRGGELISSIKTDYKSYRDIEE